MKTVRGNETVVYVNEGKICNILGVFNEEEVKALQNDNVYILEEDQIDKISSLLEKYTESEK